MCVCVCACVFNLKQQKQDVRASKDGPTDLRCVNFILTYQHILLMFELVYNKAENFIKTHYSSG